MDSINPGGMYATRVRVLGRWARSDVACSPCSAEASYIVYIASTGVDDMLQCCNSIDAPGCCATELCRACMHIVCPAHPLRGPGHMCRYAAQPLATPVATSLREQDISDPFYDDNSGLSEAERLRLVIRQMQSACKGLLQHLIDLQHR